MPFSFTHPTTGETMPVNFFSSDHHIGHGREATNRGFEATPQPSGISSSHYMDNRIGELWKEHVTDDDVVMVVGDVHGGFEPADFFHAMRFWKSLPGRKLLIPGNWDFVFERRYGKEVRDYYLPLYEAAGLEVLPDEVVINYTSPVTEAESRILVAHHPYLPDEWLPASNMYYKYPTFHPRNNEGLPLIYGHIHQGRIESTSEYPQFHIGLDEHDLRPVSAEKVGEWVESVVDWSQSTLGETDDLLQLAG